MTNKKKKGIKRFAPLIFVTVIAIVFSYYFMQSKKEKPTDITIGVSQKQDIVETVYASGKLFPATELEITSNVSGTLVSIYVKEGQSVEKGDLLAKVDPDALISIVERAEAAAEGAKAQLASVVAQKEQLIAQFDNAKLIYDRNKALLKEGVIAQSEFDISMANFKSAKANLETADKNILAAEFSVKSAQATVREQKKSLSQTSIYAPIDGLVSVLYKKQGEQVVGTAQMAGTPIMKIANLNTVEIRVEVNERDILNTSIGDTATIELDAYPDDKFMGLVTQIASTASGLTYGATQLTSDQVTNFEVRILMLPDSYAYLGLPNDQSPFRAGLSAAAEIKTNTVFDVMTVPISSVTSRIDDQAINPATEEPKECVYIKEGDTVRQQFVKIGVQNDDFIEVLQGISLNDSVVTAPFDAIASGLKTGDLIRVVSEEELYKVDAKK